MKPICVYNIQVPSDNYFVASFIHTTTHRQISCSVLDNEGFNTDVLIRLIKQCLLVGYNNSNYDDIILNYIFHNDINTSEIFALSEVLKIDKNPWYNPDISYYINKYTDTIDLSKIDTIRVGDFEPFPCRRILRHDLDILKTFGINICENILMALNRFKIDQNYGFRKKYINTSDLSLNYVYNKLGLTNTEI